MADNKAVAITTDSTCDLPKEIVEKENITVIPLSILLGEDEYKDGEDITPKDIYAYVESNGTLPKTAAVTPSAYTKVFEGLTQQGYKVVHIGFSSGLSSSFQNACVAASELDDVYCVDSKTLCTAQGLLVLKACDLRDEGVSAKDIVARIKEYVPKVSATFVLDNLKFLHKGGRCSSVAKLGANVLGIKPTIAVSNENGTLDVAKKYRGRMDIVYKQYVNDCLSDIDSIDTQRIVIANSGKLPKEALAFAKGLIESKGVFAEIIEADAGCTISSHCGPKTLAVFYLNK